VVSQFALGGALRLHGLVVLFATTIGAIVAGAIGGVFAAPFAKICIDAYQRLKAAGMFDDGTETAGRTGEGDAGGPPATNGQPPPAPG
jgi:predicted PurR-regulated permease PerM